MALVCVCVVQKDQDWFVYNLLTHDNYKITM